MIAQIIILNLLLQILNGCGEDQPCCEKYEDSINKCKELSPNAPILFCEKLWCGKDGNIDLSECYGITG